MTAVKERSVATATSILQNFGFSAAERAQVFRATPDTSEAEIAGLVIEIEKQLSPFFKDSDPVMCQYVSEPRAELGQRSLKDLLLAGKPDEVRGFLKRVLG